MSTAQRPADLRTLFAGAWRSLPAIATGSVAVCVAAVLVVLASPGVNPVSVLLAGLVVAPAFAGLVDAADRLWCGDDVTVRYLAGALRRCWRTGTAVGLVPAVPAALFLVAYEGWVQTAQPWLLAPMSVSGSLTVVANLLAVVALPLAAHDPAAAARERWLTAAHAVARRPVPAIAVVAVAALGVWACVTIAASLAVLVPGAVALTTAAAYRTILPAAVVPATPNHPSARS